MNPSPFPNSGYRPLLPHEVDERNFPLEKAQPVVPFPESYKTDLSPLPHLFQGQRSACVEHAITKAVMYYIYKKTGKVVHLSPRFLAALTVKEDGFPLSEGTNFQNALKMARKYGICEESFLRNDVDLSDEEYCDLSKITPEAYENALQYRIDSYAFLTDLSSNGRNNAVYQNGVVVIGMKICDSWWTSIKGVVSWAAKDILPLRPPKQNDPSTSGHAIVQYGYDIAYNHIDNSFGADWADGGTGYFGPNDFPYIYEAATLLFLTEEQIAALKETKNEIAEVTLDFKNFNPLNPNAPKIRELLSQVVALIYQQVKSYFV